MVSKKYGSNMHRRSNSHDYKAPGNYLFTIKKKAEAPEFSRICGNPYIESSGSGKFAEADNFYMDFPNVPAAVQGQTPMSAKMVADKQSAWHVHCRAAVGMLTDLQAKQASHAEAGTIGPYVDLTPAGRIIDEAISKIESLHPGWFEIRKYVIMPDHLHIVLMVRCYLPKDVTDYIGLMKTIATSNFKKACAELYRHEHGGSLEGYEAPGADFSLFEAGINDKIIYDARQFKSREVYVADNPRRLLIKRMIPDLFSKYQSIRVNDMIFESLGNILLLKDPELMPVHMRRHWQADERAAHAAECLAHVANGGVLISPFFNPDEAAVMRKALEIGGRIIRLRMEGFGEREKPAGREFDYCAAGQLLLLAEADSPTKRQELKYAKARRLNMIAAQLAATPAECRRASILAATKK